jgi:NTE family protein
MRKRVAIACQGGGSHTAFTAGVLGRLFEDGLPGYEVVGLSGTSGGAVCALLAWSALLAREPESAGRRLDAFWADNAASSPWERLVNASAMFFGDLQEFLVMPAVSPYDNVFAEAAADQLRRLLRRHVDFERLETEPADEQPALLLGAVDVLSGDFRVFDSRRKRITPEAVLASAAIPTLFRAVRLDEGVYWDGLFSQNPPVRELVDLAPDEIWVMQINPTRRDSEPRAVLDIADRRNELAGNLSLYQELHFIEKIDELLEDGVLAADRDYKSIMVRIIELSPSRVRQPLGVRTKLNREPEFLGALIAHGRQQASDFLTALEFERAWQAQDAQAVLGLLASDVEFISSPPFPRRGPGGGVDAVADFIADHLHGLRIDATRKQVARDAVTWTLKVRPNGSGEGEQLRGKAEIVLDAGAIRSLRLAPADPAEPR